MFCPGREGIWFTDIFLSSTQFCIWSTMFIAWQLLFAVLRTAFPLWLSFCPLCSQRVERLAWNFANENFADLFKLADMPFGHDQSEHNVSGDLLSLYSPGKCPPAVYQSINSLPSSLYMARDRGTHSPLHKSQTIRACHGVKLGGKLGRIEEQKWNHCWKIYPLNSINHMASPAFLNSRKIFLHTACVFLGGCAH